MDSGEKEDTQMKQTKPQGLTKRQASKQRRTLIANQLGLSYGGLATRIHSAHATTLGKWKTVDHGSFTLAEAVAVASFGMLRGIKVEGRQKFLDAVFEAGGWIAEPIMVDRHPNGTETWIGGAMPTEIKEAVDTWHSVRVGQ